MTKEQRVNQALLRGELIDWKWGSKQNPYIADAPRICRRLLERGNPIKKRKIKTKKSSYMVYYYDLNKQND